ncbi:FLYWCH zinc finger domain-containing protein [Phthorimaea operculella]|nr:FLYWCH zinc finger domain-containing protein [Phthorimaea operculella]
MLHAEAAEHSSSPLMVSSSTAEMNTTTNASGLEPVFTTSNFGNPLIQIGKYKFGLDPNYKNKPGPKKRWRCNLICRGCKAIVITHDNEIISCRNEHNH